MNVCVMEWVVYLWKNAVKSHHWTHDDVNKWKHFPRYWPFVRGIHLSPVNSPHKGQWRGALMFSLIWVWINGWVSNSEAGDLRCHHAHYDVTVMLWKNAVKSHHWTLSFPKILTTDTWCHLNMETLISGIIKIRWLWDCLIFMRHFQSE